MFYNDIFHRLISAEISEYHAFILAIVNKFNIMFMVHKKRPALKLWKDGQNYIHGLNGIWIHPYTLNSAQAIRSTTKSSFHKFNALWPVKAMQIYMQWILTVQKVHLQCFGWFILVYRYRPTKSALWEI